MLLLLSYLAVGLIIMIYVNYYFGLPENLNDWFLNILAVILWPIVVANLVHYREQLFDNKSSSNEDNKN